MKASGEALRRCPSCLKVKQLSEFGVDRSRRSQTQSKCRACNCVRAAEWRRNNAGRVADKRRIRRKLNSSGRRLARHWGRTSDNRVFREALAILDDEEFRIHERLSGCGPNVKEFEILDGERDSDIERRVKLVADANHLLEESTVDVEVELGLRRGEWYEAIAQKYAQALHLGQCTESQLLRLVRLRCR